MSWNTLNFQRNVGARILLQDTYYDNKSKAVFIGFP